MAEATIEIRVRDGDEENSLFIPAKDVIDRWADAHRVRAEWRDENPFVIKGVDFLRSVARNHFLARELSTCSAIIALAVLCELADDREIARVSAALAVPDTVLQVNFTERRTPVFQVRLAEIGEATRH